MTAPEPPPRAGGPATTIAALLRTQAHWCARLGSPLYAALLERAARDVEAGGPVARLLAPAAGEEVAPLVALELMGAVHHLVLAGEAPALAAHYPSVGGTGAPETAWTPFRELVRTRTDALRALRRRPIQTNEIGRCAALIGGFLVVARETALPLALLEIGASAGLNLRWDRYRYEAAGAAWGDPASPVVLRDHIVAGRPPFATAAVVASRAGCDLHPLDPGAAADRRTLLSWVWADQVERCTQLRAALALAPNVPAPVERAAALPWLAARLATPVAGHATVVFHSIVLQYLDDAARAALTALLASVGRRATRTAPLAWLRMEPGGSETEVRLTCWPGGEERLLATSGFHGRDVRWLAS